MSRMIPVLLFFACSLFAEASRYRIDSAHSGASFAVRHMMVSTVRGHMGTVAGTVDFDPSDVSKTMINATVDVKAINTRSEKRDAHLKSADFFDVEKFPTITFVSKKTEAAGQGRLKVTGDLTLRGVTKQVVLDVEGPTPPLKQANGSQRIGAVAETKLNRKDFGVNWSRTMDGGGLVVSDEVSVTIDLELISQPPTAKQ